MQCAVVGVTTPNLCTWLSLTVICIVQPFFPGGCSAYQAAVRYKVMFGPSKKPTVFRWGPPPPRSNRANLRRKDFFFAASKRHFFLRLGSVGWGGIRWGVPDRTNQRDFGGVGLPRPDPTWYRDPCRAAVVRVRGDTSLFIFVTGLRPPTVLKVHTGPQRSSERSSQRTHGGFCCQHQRKVKNTQIYEFYHFPKNGRIGFKV